MRSVYITFVLWNYLAIEAMERSPINAGEDEAWGFPLSAYCCISLQAMSACPMFLSPVKIVFASSLVSWMAALISDGNTGEHAGGGR
jgi:hypothetical protein